MVLPIDKKTAMSRAMKGLANAKRDKETAVSRQQREDAQHRIEHWQGIITKVNHMKEQVTFKAFTEMLNEVSKTTLTSYIKKAHNNQDYHDDQAGRNMVKANHGNPKTDKHWNHMDKAINHDIASQKREAGIRKAKKKLESKK